MAGGGANHARTLQHRGDARGRGDTRCRHGARGNRDAGQVVAATCEPGQCSQCGRYERSARDNIRHESSGRSPARLPRPAPDARHARLRPDRPRLPALLVARRRSGRAAAARRPDVRRAVREGHAAARAGGLSRDCCGPAGLRHVAAAGSSADGRGIRRCAGAAARPARREARERRRHVDRRRRHARVRDTPGGAHTVRDAAEHAALFERGTRAAARRTRARHAHLGRRPPRHRALAGAA